MSDNEHEFAPARDMKERQRKEERAKDSFIRAAAILSDPFQNKGEAVVHAAMGLLYLAASDPNNRALDQATGIIAHLKGETNAK